MTDADLVETGRLAMVGRLLPGALHELANPLMALMATVELLLVEVDPDTKAHERLTLVKSTSDEVAAVVRSLQRLARERLDPERTVELAPFALETVELVQRLAGMADVEVAGRAAGAARVVARPGQLRQAIVTLLLDAIGEADRGGRVDLDVAGAEVRVTPAAAEDSAVLEAVVHALGGRLGRDAGGAALLALPT